MVEKAKLEDDIKLLKKLEKLFEFNGNLKIPEGKYFVIDACSVCYIEAISDYGKKILLGFINIESDRNAIDNLQYDATEGTSKVSMEYLQKIIDILSYNDSVKISVKDDYPISFENQDFKIILAPRIEGM